MAHKLPTMSDGSVSSSSSSSDDGSTSSGVLNLGASAWNRHKEKRPLKGRTLFQQLSSLSLEGPEAASTNDPHKRQQQQQHVPIHLLQKQVYESSGPERAHVQERIVDSIVEEKPVKSELEQNVLHDCLSQHFLFSELLHHDSGMDADIIQAFDKVKFRKNEIVFRKGTPANALYILYQGDVKTIDDETGAINGKDDNSPYFGGKYTLLGELEVLTHGSYKSTAKATSSPCIFFRLDVKDFDRFRQSPLQQLSQEHRLRLLQQALPTELASYFEEDDPIVLQRLVSSMTRRSFSSGDVLVKKSRRLDAVVIIAEGTVVATNNTAGGREYADVTFGPGHKKIAFGWQSVMNGMEENASPQPEVTAMKGKVVANSDGCALYLSKRSFENAFHSHHGSTEPALE